MPSSRSFLRAALRALLPIALLAVPAAVGAVEATEVLRYHLFSGLDVGSGGEMDLSVAGDGQVLLGWTGYRPAEDREAVHVRWLSPDGLPVGPPIQVVHRGSLQALAARPGHHALVVSQRPGPGPVYRLTFLTAAGVAARFDATEIGCDIAIDVVATGNGYFLTCLSLQTFGFEGLWLDAEPLTVRGREDFGSVNELTAAGGPRSSVTVAYQDGDGRLWARWMSVWRREPPVLLDPAGFDPSVTHLRRGVFGLTWVSVHARSSDPDQERALTAVQAANLRKPGLLRSSRRFSPLIGSADEATGELRRPRLFSTSLREAVVAWFGCSYLGSPGGLLCFEDDGLFLRDRVAGRPSGAIVELPQVPERAQVGHTGELLLATRLRHRPDDLWDLEVLGFRLE